MQAVRASTSTSSTRVLAIHLISRAPQKHQVAAVHGGHHTIAPPDLRTWLVGLKRTEAADAR
jgi:hypothetical protein